MAEHAYGMKTLAEARLSTRSRACRPSVACGPGYSSTAFTATSLELIGSRRTIAFFDPRDPGAKTIQYQGPRVVERRTPRRSSRTRARG